VRGTGALLERVGIERPQDRAGDLRELDAVRLLENERPVLGVALAVEPGEATGERGEELRVRAAQRDVLEDRLERDPGLLL
jgi:hypothetical protein